MLIAIVQKSNFFGYIWLAKWEKWYSNFEKKKIRYKEWIDNDWGKQPMSRERELLTKSTLKMTENLGRK